MLLRDTSKIIKEAKYVQFILMVRNGEQKHCNVSSQFSFGPTAILNDEIIRTKV